MQTWNKNILERTSNFANDPICKIFYNQEEDFSTLKEDKEPLSKLFSVFNIKQQLCSTVCMPILGFVKNNWPHWLDQLVFLVFYYLHLEVTTQ